MKKEMKTAYDELADYYLKLRKEKSSVHFYKEILETPYLLKLLGTVKGKKLLDLGCGPGMHAKKLVRKGAKVTGIDNSKESIALAQKESPRSTFVVGDVEQLPFSANSFDFVLAALVLGHFKNWDKILKEVKRVMKKGGVFVFSIYNPFKEVLVRKKWKGREFQVVENYFDEKMHYADWKADRKKFTVYHHHKTYSTIIKLLVKHGFHIVDYEDCKPPESSKKKYLKKYKQHIDVPNFCVWKVRKK